MRKQKKCDRYVVLERFVDRSRWSLTLNASEKRFVKFSASV